ncbi:hypothetical protein ACJX0J_028677, partial [Zea mays]
WSRIMLDQNNPAKTSATSTKIQNNIVFSTSKGKCNGKLGDYKDVYFLKKAKNTLY